MVGVLHSLGLVAGSARNGRSVESRQAYSEKLKIIEGATQLGLDIEHIGFDNDGRYDLIRSSASLIGRIAYSQEHVRQTNRFATLIVGLGNEVARKLLT